MRVRVGIRDEGPLQGLGLGLKLGIRGAGIAFG